MNLKYGKEAFLSDLEAAIKASEPYISVDTTLKAAMSSLIYDLNYKLSKVFEHHFYTHEEFEKDVGIK